MKAKEINTITGQPLKEMLEELLSYWFKQAQGVDRGNPYVDNERDNHFWEVGKIDGWCEALECVYFNLYGGKQAFGNWVRNLTEDEEKAREWVAEAFGENDDQKERRELDEIR